MSSKIVFYNSRDFQDLHKHGSPVVIPITVPDLVRERCQSIKILLRKFEVDFDATISSRHKDVRSVLKNRGEEFRKLIPPIWRKRIQTCSAMYREEDTMHYTDNCDTFFHPGLYDYVDISDGGVRIHQQAVIDFTTDTRSRKLTMEQYLSAKGGEMTHGELEHHAIFRTMIPDAALRRWYVTCLRILDHFSLFDKGSQSLWRPGEIRSGYARFIALGFKGVCVYPPNVTTKGHTLACYRYPIPAES